MSNLFDYTSNSGGAKTNPECCGLPTKGSCCDDCVYEVPVKCVLPIITSSSSETVLVGSDFSYEITATEEATFQIVGLPDWITFDGVNLLSGTVPDEVQYDTFLIVAQNACGQDRKSVAINVLCDYPEAIGIWNMPTFAAPLGGGIVYAGTYLGMSYAPPSYPTGYVGPHTPYPVGLTQAQFLQLLKMSTLVISSDIEFGGYQQADPTITFEYQKEVNSGFSIPNQPSCSLIPITGTANTLIYSIFNRSPQVYKLNGLYYPAIEFRDDDNGFMTLTSQTNTSIPKLWPINGTFFGLSVPMLYDETSDYDSIYGIPGDNGPYIQGMLGSIYISN